MKGVLDISSCESTLQNIDALPAFLAKYSKTDQKSAAVESLFSQAVSFVFHLGFYTLDNNDSTIQHKVVWLGKDKPQMALAPKNGSDTIVYARNYDVLIEVTQKTGARQWTHEFASSLRHLHEYLELTKKPRDQVYLLLIAPEFFVDTYNSIRQKNIDGFNIILLTFNEVKELAQVCNLSIGLRHVDISNLFGALSRCMIDEEFEHYRQKAFDTLLNWKIAFLRNDRLVFLGVKGYRVFKDKQQKILSSSDILTDLNTQDEVKLYFDIIGQTPKREDLSSGMLTFGFAYESGVPQPDRFLSVASPLDIDKRLKEILESLNET